MPVSKLNAMNVDDVIEQIAELLQITEDKVFLSSFCAQGTATHLTIRIWTEGMATEEKDRIRSKKDETKALASKIKAKIAMSDKHPLGNRGQEQFEVRRRKTRSARYAARKKAKVHE